MGKVKKSTKKFVKNHLKGAIERRKKFQKDNKHRKVKEQKQAAAAAAAASVPDQNDGEGVGNDEISESDDDAGFQMDDSLPDLTGKAKFGSNVEDSDDEDDGGEDEDGHDEDDDVDLADLDEYDDDDDQMKAGDDELASDADDAQSDEGIDVDGDEDQKEKKLKRRHVRSEIARHKSELEETLKKDPVFYQFLKENDPDLLRFGEDEEEEDEDADAPEDLEKIMNGQMEEQSDAGDDDDEGSDADRDHGEDDEEDTREIVTKQMVIDWRQAIEKSRSLKVGRKVVLAMRTAVAGGETESEDSEELVYKIEDKTVYNLVVMTGLKCLAPLFEHHLPAKGQKKGKKSSPSDSPAWKKLSPLVKALLKLINKILDQASDESLLRVVTRESENYASYFSCFPKLAKDYLKQLLKFWTSTAAETRIVAFLSIRRLAITTPSPYLDHSIKGLYTTFATSCRTSNVHTWSSINFMINCIVEMCGIDVATGYHFGFVYIRQLAILLRNAITSGSKEAVMAVYNWQFVHCMRLWGKVLGTYCEKGSSMEGAGGAALKPLIYPFVQVVLGVMRVRPSSKYFPFRFHCIRVLNELSKKTGTFIPLASNLFEIFESSEFSKKGKNSTQKPFEFGLNLKVSNSYLGTRVFQISTAEEAVSLLIDHYDSFALSISFPELAIPACVQLRKYIKNSKNFAVNKQIQLVVEALEQNCKFIEAKRSGVDFSPKDEAKAAAFLHDIDPMTSPLRKHAHLRRKMRDEKLAAQQAQAEKEENKHAKMKKPDAEASSVKLEKPKAKSAAVAISSDGDDEEDNVEDFILSDEDDDMAADDMESDDME